MSKIILGLALAFVGAGLAVGAESPCGGRAPATGAELHGPVLHVLDGRTLCIANGVDPSQWTEVTLQDAPASASWGGLMSVAFGNDVTCVVQGSDRTAICRIGQRSIGARLNDAAVAKDAVSWKPPVATPTDAPVMRMAAADR
ncbi:MAG: hypothetical protein KKE02_13450 [Alphaproteobacteria bacterium]|nr:hypothetical protein [Alphaproteobacteria bacterium]MBU1516955.1 hypothetical protein [Alphaproteobacteria bacterium]MBU2095843.1 hypothetical protein [Alphaproteobacteria bacterium]MBU2152020.1 hypothetical protein [Alphaproteobacteria bacterium]MBU2309541.1 hypothetical protein [Alphaproteobacteria bacterium]